MEGRRHMTGLTISRIHFPVTTLGPGRRIGIWFQGCSIRCPGCISSDTWVKTPHNTTVGEVLNLCEEYRDAAEGITISGGEPFEQSDALLELLVGTRKFIPDQADVLVYSGKTFREIVPFLDQCSGLIDALISEPYLLSAGQTKPLTGSDNQMLHLLTSLGRERYQSYQRLRVAEDDRIDVQFDSSGVVWMAGIPRRGDLERLRMTLSQQGITIHTSEQTLR